MIEIPKLALTVWQPWAWLVVNGFKDIENRDWRTHYRGQVAIHAGKTLDQDCVHALTHHAGPYHPVTGQPFQIDTGSRRIGEENGFDVFNPPAWADQRGGIVGVAEIVDCVEFSDSPWFVGRYGFVLRNAQPVPFIPVKGKQGFFDWRARIAA